MTEPRAAHTAAQLLAEAAHTARNDVATLLAVVQLLDDPAVAADARHAVQSLRARLERGVVAARVELGERPADVELSVLALAQLGLRRAQREGTVAPELEADADGDTHLVRGPGSWLERLVTDLLHLTTGPARVRGDSLEVSAPVVVTAAMGAYLEALANACGVVLERADDRVVVTFPSVAGEQ